MLSQAIFQQKDLLQFRDNVEAVGLLALLVHWRVNMH